MIGGPPYLELVLTIGKLGKIIDYLLVYIKKLNARQLRATIHVVRVQHK